MLCRNTTRLKPAEYVARLEKTLSACHQAARINLHEAQLHQKRTYDIKSYTCSYEVGVVVFMVDTSSKVGQSKKLRKPWIGPCVIVFKINNVLYRIQGRIWNRVVHHDRLNCARAETIPYGSKDSDTRFSNQKPEGVYVARIMKQLSTS